MGASDWRRLSASAYPSSLHASHCATRVQHWAACSREMQGWFTPIGAVGVCERGSHRCLSCALAPLFPPEHSAPFRPIDSAHLRHSPRCTPPRCTPPSHPPPSYCCVFTAVSILGGGIPPKSPADVDVSTRVRRGSPRSTHSGEARGQAERAPDRGACSRSVHAASETSERQRCEVRLPAGEAGSEGVRRAVDARPPFSLGRGYVGGAA